jgi:hypothetical protein
MNKYYMNHNNMEMEPCSTGQYYLVSDVDARITELERALKSCALAINSALMAHQSFANIANEATEKANKALALSAGP